MGAPAIKIRELDFAYSASPGPIFSGLELTVEEGERFGIFGPNGAGKTTLMKLMTGVLSRQRGVIEIAGRDIDSKGVKKLFGLVPQELSFYEELTPAENLEFFGAWYGLSRQEIRERMKQLLEVLDLEPAQNRKAQQLSGGMKRKLNLAIGILHQPRVLFLDEPTVGVDVHTRLELIRYLIDLNGRGTSLIYTSHQLDEAEALCQRVALIDKGRIIACDDLPSLLAEHAQDGLEGLFLSLTGRTFEKV